MGGGGEGGDAGKAFHSTGAHRALIARTKLPTLCVFVCVLCPLNVLIPWGCNVGGGLSLMRMCVS